MKTIISFWLSTLILTISVNLFAANNRPDSYNGDNPPIRDGKPTCYDKYYDRLFFKYWGATKPDHKPNEMTSGLWNYMTWKGYYQVWDRLKPTKSDTICIYLYSSIDDLIFSDFAIFTNGNDAYIASSDICDDEDMGKNVIIKKLSPTDMSELVDEWDITSLRKLGELFRLKQSNIHGGSKISVKAAQIIIGEMSVTIDTVSYGYFRSSLPYRKVLYAD